jgi:hypothetical protein
MLITNELFSNYLDCRRKAHQKAAGLPGVVPDIERVQVGLETMYQRRALEAYIGAQKETDVLRDPGSLSQALLLRPQYVVNATGETELAKAHFDLLESLEDGATRTVLVQPDLEKAPR